MALFLRRACIQANVRLMQSLRVVYELGIPAEIQEDDKSTVSKRRQATVSSKNKSWQPISYHSGLETEKCLL